jgi:hypothetical protein
VFDCGSDFNILSDTLYENLPEPRPPLTPVEPFDPPLEGATGAPLVVRGTVAVELSIGPIIIPDVQFLVIKNMSTSLAKTPLLGTPFSKQHLLGTSWVENHFTLRRAPDIRLPFLPLPPPPPLSQPPSLPPIPLFVLRNICIPAHSSVYVRMVTQSWERTFPETTPTPIILFEPNGAALELLNLSSPFTVVEEDHGNFTIQLDNLSTRPVQLAAGCELGHLCTAEMVWKIEHPVSTGCIHPQRALHIAPSPMEINTFDMGVQLDLTPSVTLDLSGTSSLTPSQQQELRRFLSRNVAVFAGDSVRSPRTHLYHHRIDIGSNPPVNIPPYRVGPIQREEIERQVQEMLNTDVIRPSDSPFSSPVLLVKKNDGSERFCVDFRRLNAFTRKDVYPLPRIDDMLDGLGRSSFFTTLDLQSGFWQIPIYPPDIEKTAFSTHRGHYEFVVMPFGLTNAPATFQRMMDNILRADRDFCLVYMDDIIVFSPTFESHLIHVQQVFNRLLAARLVLKPKKCRFFRSSVKFLGHVVSENRVQPDPEKVSAVHQFPPPTSVKQLQSFLGLVSYYRRFVHHLASLAEPLYKLTKKDSPWRWRAEVEQAAMDRIKTALTTPPLLRLPDFSRPFVLYTDASDVGLGAVLSQSYEEAPSTPKANGSSKRTDDKSNDTTIPPHRYIEHPIYYASRTLHAAERNYTTTERECLAVKWAVTLFRPYLLGRHFIVYTDHSALRWLFTTRDPSSKLTRMILLLQDYDFEIIARPGTQNANADALSRLSELLPPLTPLRHSLVAAVTRSRTHTLPAGHRTGVDPDLALDALAYDLDAAVLESVRQSTALDAKGMESITQDAEEDDRMELEDEDDVARELEGFQLEDGNNSLLEMEEARSTTEDPHSIFNEPVNPFTPSALITAQLADPVLHRLRRILLNPSPTDPLSYQSIPRSYGLYEEVLCRTKSAAGEIGSLSRKSHRPVIPRSLRPALLIEYHDSVIGGHFGIDKTYGRLAEKYYWPGMWADVKQYVATCPRCSGRKTPIQHRQVPLLSVPLPSMPFEALSIDVLGPLPKTKLGNKFILVVTDCFTRWPMAFAMRNQQAPTIATLLVEQVFCQHGFPTTLLSDRGTNFLSSLMAAVLDIFRVKKLSTSSYHPQTNGLTERFNHTLCSMLSNYVNQRQDDWDTYIPYVLLAFRSVPQSTTHLSPFHLLYGRPPRFPLDTLLSPPSATYHLDDGKAADYVVKLVEKLALGNAAVSAVAKKLGDARQRTNELLTHLISFTLGQLVSIFRPAVKKGLAKKLSQQWKGPYKVTEVYHNGVNYRVQLLNKAGTIDPRSRSLLVHVSMMKEWKDPQSSSIRSQSASSPSPKDT